MYRNMHIGIYIYIYIYKLKIFNGTAAEIKIVKAHELILIIFLSPSHELCLIFANQKCCNQNQIHEKRDIN